MSPVLCVNRILKARTIPQQRYAGWGFLQETRKQEVVLVPCLLSHCKHFASPPARSLLSPHCADTASPQPPARFPPPPRSPEVKLSPGTPWLPVPRGALLNGHWSFYQEGKTPSDFHRITVSADLPGFVGWEGHS